MLFRSNGDKRPDSSGHWTDGKVGNYTTPVDGYFCELGGPVDAYQIRRIAYWYSMWSHRRDGLWKGFVQVDLDPSQDGLAQKILTANGGVRHE